MNRIHRQLAQTGQQRRGAMLVMVALVIVILLVGAMLSVDVAYMHMVRAELRTATDAAARAGAESLARTQDVNVARATAINMANQNSVSGQGLQLSPSDIVFGSVNENANGKLVFQPGVNPFTSVRVTGARVEGSASGPVPLFFAKIFGTTNFQPVQNAVASSSVRDIAIVLDRSGSMSEPDAGGGLTRNQALINAVTQFINEIEASSPNAAMSLTTYSTNASRDIELTQNFASLRTAVGNLPTAGFTNIKEGLQFGSDSLETDPNRRSFAERTIIVMTDGQFNRPLPNPSNSNPTPSADLAASRGHTVHTITFSAGANQTIMQDIARIGNGLHFHADTAGDLTDAFRSIAETLSVVLTE